jgi:hypothetical protein
MLGYLFADNASVGACLDAADVNDSGDVDIADAVYTLSYLFADGPAPAPPFAGCGEDQIPDELTCDTFRREACPAGPPAGTLVSASDCKSFTKGEGVPKDEECALYEYGPGNILRITHANAGLNCCPGTITATVLVEDETVTIQAKESYDGGGPCMCLCLFDLVYEIQNMLPGTYTVHLETTVGEGLHFSLELSSGSSGSYCEPREDYPWGIW